jgi:hypothetical protein
MRTHRAAGADKSQSHEQGQTTKAATAAAIFIIRGAAFYGASFSAFPKKHLNDFART